MSSWMKAWNQRYSECERVGILNVKPIIKNLNEMTDSRELMEAKTHPFISIFIGFLLIIILAALTWSYFGEMDIVVKASGVVRPNEKVSRVTNKVLARVESVHFTSGQHVKQGDLLYTLEREQLSEQLQTIQEQMDKTNEELKSLEDLKREMVSRNGLGSSPIELSRFNRQVLEVEDTVRSNFEIEFNRLEFELEDARMHLNNYQLLEQSISSQSNLFQSGDEFFYKYEDFISRSEQLDIQAQKMSEQFKEFVVQTGDSRTVAYEMKETQLNAENYKNEYLLSIQTSMKELNKQVRQIELQMADLNVQFIKTIDAAKEKLKELMSQKRNIELSLEDREVRSPIEGTVNVITDIAAGDLVQTGSEILTIVPKNDSDFVVELALHNQDIANIHPGDQVKFNFLALPSQEYGHLTGHIRTVSVDATQHPQNGVSYYVAEASLEDQPLYSNKGEEARVKVGMVVEAHVITRSEKILYYLLEKIDLRE